MSNSARTPALCGVEGPENAMGSPDPDLVDHHLVTPADGLILLGREREQRAVRAVVDAARAGMSRALVLRGEAGMGKTALVRWAVAGTNLTRLSVAGIEAESGFAFAGLQRLLAPVIDRRENLPSHQREALEVALGLAGGPRPDQFLVALAVLTLVSGFAAGQGLLCVIDDSQWLDRETLEVIAFVTRRLHAEPVGMVFAIRALPDDITPLDDLPTLTVDGLGRKEAEQLLVRSVGRALDPDLTERVVRETQGCPLALIELGAELMPEQLERLIEFLEPLPIGRRLGRHYMRRVRALPCATQMLLLAAAADSSRDQGVLRRVCLILDLPVDADTPAVEAGLVERRGWLQFRHPLIRSAVYSGAPSTELRRVHQAFAEVTSPDKALDRYAWHRAAACLGPDETVAFELERAAVVARQRSGVTAEVTFLARAAELTPNRRDRSRRFLDGAETALAAGHLRQARRLLEDAAAIADEPLLRAKVRWLEAALDSHSFPGDAAARLFAAAQGFEALDRRMARDTYLEALQGAISSGQLTRGTSLTAIAHAALALPPSPDRSNAADVILEAFATRFTIGFSEAVPMLRHAVNITCNTALTGLGVTRRFVLGLFASYELWDLEGARRILGRIEPSQLSRGELESLRITLLALCQTSIWSGDINSAASYRTELMALVAAIEGDGPVSDAWGALTAEVLAWQGRDEEALANISASTDELIQCGVAGSTINIGFFTRTVLDLARSRYRNALKAAWQLYVHDIPPTGNLVLPYIVEAGVRSGDNAAAATALERLDERASSSGTHWAQGLLARSRALMTGYDEAESLYQESLQYLSAPLHRADLARSHLVYGEWLRRRKRRRDARQELQRAYEIFLAIGAMAFAERTAMELAASGAEANRTDASALRTRLTPREDQIARLAAQGETDTEIATTLFISANTVDYHLRKIYRKLGITSRRDLRSVLH